MERQIPLFTLSGVPDAKVSSIPFTTGDKLGLTLTRFTRDTGVATDAVLVIHGLTTSTDMFIMPEHYNLVRYLLDHGFRDVFCLDYRMSNRLPYNLHAHRFTMDDVALYDHPAAIEEMRRHVGERRIHVISHCLGAVSFTMSLFGKAARGVTSVIANSAALTPRVPLWSRVKLLAAPFLVEHVLSQPYLSPSWSEDPGLTIGKVVSKVASAFHPECDVPACHMLSFMWGTGWPALYHHANLHPVTHLRGGDLYGGTGLNYFRHVHKMVSAGRAVKYDPTNDALSSLPDDYLAGARDIETPVLLVTGADNHVFTDSNVVCFEKLEAMAPGRHQLAIIPGYGHQDVFMGKSVAEDVFPTFLAFLTAQASAVVPSVWLDAAGQSESEPN
jgi:lysosomal acid lipase/cholesteryl ester hydrolase